MTHSTLGPALETFGPNYKITGILFVIGLVFSGIAYAVADDLHDRTGWMIFDGTVLFFGALVWSHLVCRAWLHETGISYRKILGSGEIRWMEVEQIYFGTYEVNAHMIPLGTFCNFRIVTTQQRKISFGSSIRDAEVLFDAASKKTFDLLYQKAVQEYNSGSEVEFGAVRVSRETGVTIRRWFRTRTIPWRDIAGFQFDGHFVQFDRVSSRFVAKVDSEHVANTRALHALLTGVMRQVW